MKPKIKTFDTKLKHFYILFSQLEEFGFIKIVNSLADNAFKYPITLSEKIILPIIVSASYIFNLLTNLQYNK